MVDIHCHLLPGVDDGASTLDESLQMAEAAIAEGITHIVATPHSSDDFVFDAQRVRSLRNEVQARIGPRLTLATGCDFHLNLKNLEDVEKYPGKYTINQKNYLLVEFNEFAIPPSMDEKLHDLQLAGLSPIITHPERNWIICSQPSRLAGWVQRGFYVQVTAAALTGGFGPTAQRYADDWIDQGLVHFVASDAHNVKRRPLTLRPAYEVVEARCGKEIALALLVQNPLAAFEGRPLPFTPEILGKASKPKKRFFFF
ncbi:MAG TPA: CpsB/CapC family capsule biosynthesis tyrosine phosphatase [Candidatus Dormibacteraeota bacterium]|nr:CpsB/CapC family capsule biosynthesis tyrosine phosphatase [Candidatus Dormibacteraeota bacterium]